MNKTVAIIQSNYIPWKGYFDLINMADEFIIYDHVQYTRRDWRNRNKIKTPDGLLWLTIPVNVSGKYFQAIREVEVSNPAWNEQHWKTILNHYSRARCFGEYRGFFEDLYLNCHFSKLSEINYRFITAICGFLNIKTKISWSTDYDLNRDLVKTERLVDICRQADATEYISGPAAKDYIEPELFDQANIVLTYMDYSGYPEYEQPYPPFDHYVSIVDLILNTGPQARLYMKTLKNTVTPE